MEQIEKKATDDVVGLDMDISNDLTITIREYPDFKYVISRNVFGMCEQGRIMMENDPTETNVRLESGTYTERPYQGMEREVPRMTPTALSNVLDYMVYWHTNPEGHKKASAVFMTPEEDAKGLVVDETKFLRVDRDKPFVDNFSDDYEKKLFGRLFTRPQELTKTIMCAEYLGVPTFLEKACFTYTCYIDRLEHKELGFIPDAVRHRDPVIKAAKEKFEKEEAHKYTVPAEKDKARNEYAEKICEESIEKYLKEYGYQAMSDLMYTPGPSEIET